VVHEEDVVGVCAEWYGVLLECLEDSTAQLAQDGVLLIDCDSNTDGISYDASLDGIDAGDDGIGEGDLLEGGIVSQG